MTQIKVNILNIIINNWVKIAIIYIFTVILYGLFIIKSDIIWTVAIGVIPALIFYVLKSKYGDYQDNQKQIKTIDLDRNIKDIDPKADLKTASASTETLKEKIKAFQIQRISKITANQAPIFLNHDLKLIIHLIPLNAFCTVNYDLSEIETKLGIFENLIPIQCRYSAHRYNFDGFLIYEVPEEEIDNYVQLFKNGIIESVIGAPHYDEKRISAVYTERYIVQYVSLYLKALKELSVETPILIFLTLTGVKGYSMQSNSRNPVLIDRDILPMSDVMIESYDDKIEYILKPVFDSVWNACGLNGSENYDKDGEWIE